MELDDLRRHWQQPEPVAAPTPPLAFGRRPTPPPGNLIAKMRRNVWGEIVAALLFALLPLLLVGGGFRLLYVGAISLLAAITGIHYARQLRLLQQMDRTDTSIKGHLKVLCAGLRQLLRSYYLLTIWVGPLTLLLVLGYYVERELVRPAGPRWLELGVITSLVLVLGLMGQFGVIRLTRWFLQRLYGQHLDRLEGQLRELDDNEPPAGSGSMPDFTA